MTIDLDDHLLLVGAGKMGSAMLTGWLKAGLSAAQVVVQEPAPGPELLAMASQHGFDLVAQPPAGVTPAVIVMAIKPQAMEAVFPLVAAHASAQTLIVSIAAGRSLASFEKHLTNATPVVRAMPNTPAAIGMGITVCCGNAHVSAAHRAMCDKLLGAVGDVAWVEKEALIDPVTAVSGSGPAYVFLLAECLAAAGVEAGLERGLADKLARATIAGSGALLQQAPEAAATLRQNVTSPGGTTAAALEVLMAEPGLQALMMRAVAAATKRGRELGG